MNKILKLSLITLTLFFASCSKDTETENPQKEQEEKKQELKQQTDDLKAVIVDLQTLISQLTTKLKNSETSTTENTSNSSENNQNTDKVNSETEKKLKEVEKKVNELEKKVTELQTKVKNGKITIEQLQTELNGLKKKKEEIKKETEVIEQEVEVKVKEAETTNKQNSIKGKLAKVIVTESDYEFTSVFNYGKNGFVETINATEFNTKENKKVEGITKFVYDNNGNIIEYSVIYTKTNNPFYKRTIEYSNGKVVKVNHSGYDDKQQGKLDSKKTFNYEYSTQGVLNKLTITYSYVEENWSEKKSLYEFKYDEKGNIIEIKRTEDNQVSTTTYTFDDNETHLKDVFPNNFNVVDDHLLGVITKNNPLSMIDSRNNETINYNYTYLDSGRGKPATLTYEEYRGKKETINTKYYYNK